MLFKLRTLLTLFFLILCCPSKSAVLPLTKTLEGHLVVALKVNNSDANFILDTGASGTVIFTQNLAEFNINFSNNEFDGIGIGGKANSAVNTVMVDINSLSLANYKSSITKVYTQYSEGVFPKYIKGILGSDVLNDLRVFIDLEESQLVIINGDVHTSLAHLPFMKIEHSPLGISYIEAHIASQKVSLILDTGASQTVLDSQSLAELGFTLSNHPTAKTISETGEELPMQVLKDQVLNIDNKNLKGSFFTTDLSGMIDALNSESNNKYIGILGLKELLIMRALIDLANSRIYFKK